MIDIEAEVYYAVRNEYAQTAVDFIGRRSRLGFLNATAALDALPRVIEIMGSELGWNADMRKREWIDARDYLVSMGLPPATHGEIENVDLSIQGGVSGWFDFGVGNKVGGAFKKLKRDVGFTSTLPSRAHFSLEELEALRVAWVAHGGDDDGKVGIRPADVVKISGAEAKFVSGGMQADLRDVVHAMVSVGIQETAGSLSFDEFVDVSIDVNLSLRT